LVVFPPHLHVVIVVVFRTDRTQENGRIRVWRVLPIEKDAVPDRQDGLRIGREGRGELDSLGGVATGTGGHPGGLHR